MVSGPSAGPSVVVGPRLISAGVIDALRLRRSYQAEFGTSSYRSTLRASRAAPSHARGLKAPDTSPARATRISRVTSFWARGGGSGIGSVSA
jgi:hypothetical protein